MALKIQKLMSREGLLTDLNRIFKWITKAIDDISGGTDTDAIHDNVASEISAITEKGTPINADLVVIEDSADSNNKKRAQLGNLPGGGGGEANTVSNAGAGVSLFYQKTGVDLEFNGIKSEIASLLTCTLDSGSHDIELTVIEANIDHDALTNYTIAEHRTINDLGTSTSELWSSDKISGELDVKAAASHTHLEADITDLDHTDVAAIHDNVAGEIGALSNKGTLVTADAFLIEDSETGSTKKQTSLGNIQTAITITEAQISDLDHTDADAIHDNVSGEIAAITLKATPEVADLLLIEDSDVFNDKARITISGLQGMLTITEGQISDLDHTDADAIHDNVAAEISAITEKGTPVSADLLIIEDSAASNAKKRVQIGNLPGGGGGLTVSGSTVFSGSSPTSWTDLDLSTYVGENSALVILSISGDGDMNATAVRQNGDTLQYYDNGVEANAYGAALAHHDADAVLILICVTDTAGVIEWITETSQTASIKLIAYVT